MAASTLENWPQLGLPESLRWEISARTPAKFVEPFFLELPFVGAALFSCELAEAQTDDAGVQPLSVPIGRNVGQVAAASLAGLTESRSPAP